MNTEIEEAFEMCLQCLAQGHDVEICLAHYPHLSNELRPLLLTAQAAQHMAHSPRRERQQASLQAFTASSRLVLPRWLMLIVLLLVLFGMLGVAWAMLPGQQNIQTATLSPMTVFQPVVSSVTPAVVPTRQPTSQPTSTLMPRVSVTDDLQSHATATSAATATASVYPTLTLTQQLVRPTTSRPNTTPTLLPSDTPVPPPSDTPAPPSDTPMPPPVQPPTPTHTSTPKGSNGP